MLRLVLWDVDHTLIENAGVSKEIYADAYEQLTGMRPSHPAVTEGRTDPDIMADMLRSHASPDITWERVQEALRRAGANHRQALADRGARTGSAGCSLRWLMPMPHRPSSAGTPDRMLR